MLLVIFSLLLFFHVFYAWAVSKNDFSIIDIAWGPSFLVIYCAALANNLDTLNTRVVLIGVLVLIWSSRLSLYIYFRALKTGKEDYRYAQWRADWGEKANQIAYVRVFLLQALLSLVMGSPLYFIHKYSSEVSFGTFLDILGLVLWLIGFIFESVGDYQKNIFKSKPENKNKIMQSGLWRYTRHPNYFGEALLWWGIFLIIINQVPLYLALVGPFVLNFFLLKVSGVSMLEEKYIGNVEFDLYKKKTNSFIPWFPKRLK